MPVTKPAPPGVVVLAVDGFTLPLQLLLWAAGRPPVWAERIRAALGEAEG